VIAGCKNVEAEINRISDTKTIDRAVEGIGGIELESCGDICGCRGIFG
jgi:hypothetical protein